ncbi:MAG TPA: lytic transglycosylase domain-containing protein [Candidatus Binataceae bacterium]|nr:lytic transglycosylase domain-containing protein [Candidatus Binataceae bacterium]
MRLAIQLPVLMLACFAISCGAAYDSGESVAPTSRDTISVQALPASTSQPSAKSRASNQSSSQPLAIVARNSVANETADSETAAVLPDLPVESQDRALLSMTPSALAPNRVLASSFERSEPVKAAPFPLILNQTARRYVQDFLDHTEGLNNSFDRSAPYIAEMRKMLEQHGVPADFVYLSFAESEFSKWGAGPWQLTKDTARRFGLRVNNYVDERRDPIKSTRVAAEYLARLHDQVDDWRLAVVGWNTGEKSILRFIQLRGMDYESMATSLPPHTRALLDRFMAVAFIAHHADEFGVENVQYLRAPVYDRLTVRGGTTVVHAAKLAHTTPAMIRMLNPALLRDRVPPTDVKYELVIPHSQTLATKL